MITLLVNFMSHVLLYRSISHDRMLDETGGGAGALDKGIYKRTAGAVEVQARNQSDHNVDRSGEDRWICIFQ